MIRLVAALSLSIMLAACGVDGDPEPPRYAGAVTINNNDVYPSVAVSQGPVSIFLGL